MTIIELISAERKTRRGAKICVTGVSGVGKTSLVWTLPEKDTLFLDLEAGDLALEGWKGTSIRPRTWKECRDIACILGGPNPAKGENDPTYSFTHYDCLTKPRENETPEDFKKKMDTNEVLKKFNTVFVDSITHAGRLCFSWCQNQPECVTRDGSVDIRSAYGLHGREMISWLTQLQHMREKDVIFACILDKKLDDFNRPVYSMQIEGAKTGIELPGIVDEMITMAIDYPENGDEPKRIFVCQTLNRWGYPAKDRSSKLDVVEEPHLGRLLKKLKGKRTNAIARSLTYELPTFEEGEKEDAS